MAQPKAPASQLYNRPVLLLLCLWLVTVLIYLPSYNAGFIADFLGMFEAVERLSFADFVNRSEAHVKSFYQVTQLQMFLFIRLFGTHFLPWFLIFTFLHALNGLLAFRFFSRLFGDFSLPRAHTIALAGALLFLFSPNITEVTVWKGGYHYLTGILMQLLILLWCRRYLLSGQARYCWYAALLFAISLFTLEIFYLTPPLVLLLIAGYYWKGIAGRAVARKALLCCWAPLVLLFLAHLVLYKLSYGHWIAHYGDTSTFAASTGEVLPRVGKYLAYVIALAGQFPMKVRKPLYELASQPWFYYTISCALVLITVFIVARFRRLKPGMQIAGFLLAGIIGSLVLIIPIFFDDLFSMYNSRRCYQLSLFTSMLLALLIFGLLRNIRAAALVYGIYLALCLILTVRVVVHWHMSAKLQYALLRNFKSQQADTVLLLNLPTYFQDIRMIPANDFNEFNSQLRAFGYDTVKGRLYSVSSYNMQHGWDGAHVTVVDSLTLKVTLNQWGAWWMYNYLGASGYQSELFEVVMTDPGHEYLLRLKSRPGDMVILFQQGMRWKQVDMDRPGEQW